MWFLCSIWGKHDAVSHTICLVFFLQEWIEILTKGESPLHGKVRSQTLSQLVMRVTALQGAGSYGSVPHWKLLKRTALLFWSFLYKGCFHGNDEATFGSVPDLDIGPVCKLGFKAFYYLWNYTCIFACFLVWMHYVHLCTQNETYFLQKHAI